MEFEDLLSSKTFTSTSEYMNNEQSSYEQLKHKQMQNVLYKIDLDIHENMNKTIKQSINDIDLIMQNPIKINSLPVKNPSSNSFLTPFFDDNMIDEVKDNREDDRKLPVNQQKARTSPPFFKDNTRISNFKGFNNTFLPMNALPFEIKNGKIEVKKKSNGNFMEEPTEISQDFDPASYVNPQFLKGLYKIKKNLLTVKKNKYFFEIFVKKTKNQRFYMCEE